MSYSKLITLELLQQFSEKCKQTFSPSHVKAKGEGSQYIIKFNADLTDFKIYLGFNGFLDSSYLDSSIYFTDKGLVINHGPISITEAYFYKSDSYALLYITLSDSLDNVSMNYFIVKDEQLINCVEEFIASPFNSPTGCEKLSIYVKPEQKETSFQIKNASGNYQTYPNTDSFDSIYDAYRVAGITFTTSDSDDAVTTDLTAGSVIALPTVTYKAGDNIKIEDNKISTSIPDASDSTKGLVQIGNGITCNNGVISVQIDKASEYELGTIKVNGSVGEDQLPVQINDEGFAYVAKEDAHRFKVMPEATIEQAGKIVEFIGDTNSTYTQGYFYICQPNYIIQIPCLKEIDPEKSTGEAFAKYMETAQWESGEAVNVKDFEGIWSYYYTPGFLNIFNTTRSIMIPEDDFPKFNMIAVSDTASAGNASFSGSDFAWIQKNVQPLAYLDTEALEFMTNADTDSIFAEPVTEFKILDQEENKIPDNFETTKNELVLSVSPSEYIYSYSGDVQLSYNENEELVLLINGNGVIYFKSVIYPDVTKTINIIKNEETV